VDKIRTSADRTAIYLFTDLLCINDHDDDDDDMSRYPKTRQ